MPDITDPRVFTRKDIAQIKAISITNFALQHLPTFHVCDENANLIERSELLGKLVTYRYGEPQAILVLAHDPVDDRIFLICNPELLDEKYTIQYLPFLCVG